MPQSQSPPLPGVPGLCGGPVPGGLSGGNRMAGWRRRGTPRRRPGRVLAHPNLSCTELCPPPRGGGLPPLWHVPALRVAGGPGEVQVRYLVDSASSHMLVSKIKPCMSKYKQLVL
jgi:hypothetical protein